MSMLFFDTETTGVYNFDLPADHPNQPHICQLAAMLTKPDGQSMSEFNVLISPDDWVIPSAATEVHGITNKDCESHGVDIHTVIPMLRELMDQADFLVAHNIGFDIKMLERYESQHNMLYSLAPSINRLAKVCTMELCTDLVKAPLSEKQKAAQDRHRNSDGSFDWQPPGGWPEYKKPNLQECYQHLFGKAFDGAHDAMADVRACRDVYVEVMK